MADNPVSVIESQIAKLLAGVRRPGDFFVAGHCELAAPALEVTGVGPIALPLLPMQADMLVEAAEPAPYGRGEETIFDPTVRRCRQIAPDRIRIGGGYWNRMLDTILARVATGFGIDGTTKQRTQDLKDMAQLQV